MTTTSKRRVEHRGPPDDEFSDERWPVGFDKDGEPNVVGYIPDVEAFLKSRKPRNEPQEPEEQGLGD